MSIADQVKTRELETRVQNLEARVSMLVQVVNELSEARKPAVRTPKKEQTEGASLV